MIYLVLLIWITITAFYFGMFMGKEYFRAFERVSHLSEFLGLLTYGVFTALFSPILLVYRLGVLAAKRSTQQH